MKEVALITLHGMGKEDPDYYEGLMKGLQKEMGENWEKVSFHPVHYAPVLQGPQDQLWRDMKRESDNDLDYNKVRKFFLFSFGDAGVLEYSAHKNEKLYIDVQKLIQQALSNAYSDFGRQAKPVVIFAQSLGCQVISNYLWDAGEGSYVFKNSAGTDPDEIDFLKCKSLKQLFTTGCNIPLFVSGLAERRCFKKPNDDFSWDNYYDPDDVLGWPLKQLGDSYTFIRDHHINAGSIWTSWNPASHLGYWTDKDIVKPLAETLTSSIR